MATRKNVIKENYIIFNFYNYKKILFEFQYIWWELGTNNRI
jgi:hypothetical protein